MGDIDVGIGAGTNFSFWGGEGGVLVGMRWGWERESGECGEETVQRTDHVLVLDIFVQLRGEILVRLDIRRRCAAYERG